MKQLLLCLFLASSGPIYSQKMLPVFLSGTWKTESQERFEHWDVLNENTLKGFSYELKNGILIVSEYLEIKHDGKDIFYNATVVNQNQGKAVSFKLRQGANNYLFENPAHDFPRRIIYKKNGNNEISVSVSDGMNKGDSFKMFRQQPAPELRPDSASANPNYDAVLAKKLGGDEYGMKGYVLVILKTGPNKTSDKDLINDRFRGHMENIDRLVAEKKLIVAGPLGKNDKAYRGIFILSDVGNLDEAKELLQTDPAIKEGLLDVELYKWYGSAALPVYLDASEKIWKAKP